MVSLNKACFSLAYQLSHSTSDIDTVSSKSCGLGVEIKVVDAKD